MNNYYLYVKTKPKHRKFSLQELKSRDLVSQIANMSDELNIENLLFFDKLIKSILETQKEEEELKARGIEKIEVIKKDYTDMPYFYIVNLDNYENSYAYCPGSIVHPCPLTEEFVKNELCDLKSFICDAEHIYRYATVKSKINGETENIIVLYKLNDLILSLENGEFDLFPIDSERITVEYGDRFNENYGMDTIYHRIVDRINNTPYDYDDYSKKLKL